ncbi:MAG: DNA primase [Dethiobacteria bacterium]
MKRPIPEEALEEIRRRCDLVELVGEYLKLEKRGKNYVGLCPFHHEKTPSFTISPEKQLFHCFGCGASGNIFSFIMKLEGLTFPEAALALARKTGVELPKEESPSPEDSLKEKIYRVNQMAAQYYHYCLTRTEAGKKAREYLQRRGITSESVKLFQLGYAPRSWQGLLNFAAKKGVPAELLAMAGLVTERRSGGYYDRFRGRLIFPVHNLGGQVVGFGGRILEEGSASEPKYLNSPETPVFEKGQVLYGLHLAKEEIRRRRAAVVVEGYTDVIIPYQAGIKNVVASLGTALTTMQGRLLRTQTDVVFIAYDADSAGEAATWRGLKILQEAGVSVKVVQLPQGSDPDSLVREQGEKAFRELLEQALPLTDYQLEQLQARYNLSAEEGRRGFLAEVLPLLESIANLVERDTYLKKTAELLKVSEESLRGELKKFVRRAGQKRRGFHNLSLKDQTNNINQLKVKPAEKILISLMLQGEGIAAIVQNQLSRDDFEDESVRRIVELIWELSKSRPVTGEVIINYFSEESIHALITSAVTEPSLQNLPADKMEQMARECIRKIKAEKESRRRAELRKRIREMERQGLVEQARELLREHLQAEMGEK